MPRLTASRLLITLSAVVFFPLLVGAGVWAGDHNAAHERDCANANCAEDFTALVATPEGSGSGVLIDAEHVLTAAHVIDGASQVMVSFLNDLTPHRALGIATSSCDDLAVIRIERTTQRPVRFAPASPKVGEFAYVVGFPDESYTAARGQVRNYGVQLTYLHDLLQTDGRILPGNSGGPLINDRGELIGMVTARVASVDRIGFAVDIQAVKTEIARLTGGTSANAACQRFDEDCGWPSLKNDAVDFGCSEAGLYVSALSQGAEARIPSPYDRAACSHYVLRTRTVTEGYMAQGLVAYFSPSDYLVAAVSSARNYGIFRFTDGALTTLTSFTRSDKVRADKPNDLTLEVDGARITFTVNETKFQTLADPTMGPEVRYGLYGRSFATSAEPTTGYFSWAGFECRE